MVRPVSLPLIRSGFGFEDVVGIRYDFTVADGGEVLQTDINADFRLGEMLNRSIRQFTGKDSEPLSCLINLQRHSLDFSLWSTVQNNRNISDFRGIEPLIGQKLESRLRIGDALNPRLESRIAFFSVAILNSTEKVVKRFGSTVRDVLQNLRVGLFVIGKRYLHVKNQSVEVVLSRGQQFLVQVKKRVVRFLADFEISEKSHSLLRRGINPVFEHLLNDHREVKSHAYI